MVQGHIFTRFPTPNQTVSSHPRVPRVIRALCEFPLEIVIFCKTSSSGEIIVKGIIMIKGTSSILILSK